MIVAVLVTLVGLLLGIVVVQTTGLRLSGVLVVPLLAIYGLYEFVAVPILLASTVVTYAILTLLEQRTLLIGRELLVAALLLSLSIPLVLGSPLLVLGGDQLPVTEITSMGSLLSGVAAYNYRQLDENQRLDDVIASAGGFLGLFVLGGALVTPAVAATVGTELPLLLFSSESDIALLRGAAIQDRTTAVASPLLLVPALVAGVLLTEGAYKRWGIRLLGTIVLPLLALFTLRNSLYLAIYLGVLPVTFVAVELIHRRTLLYGRVLLALSLSVSLLAVVPVAVLFDQLSGYHCYFVAVFGGIGAYNLHRLTPSDRPHSLALSGGLFAGFLAGFGAVVTPTLGGTAVLTSLAAVVASLCLVVIGGYSAYLLEQRRIEPGERSTLLDRLRGRIGVIEGSGTATGRRGGAVGERSAVSSEQTTTAPNSATTGGMAAAGTDADTVRREQTASPGAADERRSDEIGSSRRATADGAASRPDVSRQTEHTTTIEAGGGVFAAVDQLPPTERFTGVILYEVWRGSHKLGYTVILGREQDDLLLLDRNGAPAVAPLTPEQFVGEQPGGSATAVAVFDSEQDARDTYLEGSLSDTDRTPGGDTRPNELVPGPGDQLEHGWVLSELSSGDGPGRRYCLVRSSEDRDRIEVIDRDGGVETFAPTAPLDAYPAFDTEAAARSAYRMRIEEQQKVGQRPEPVWPAWTAVRQAPPKSASRRQLPEDPQSVSTEDPGTAQPSRSTSSARTQPATADSDGLVDSFLQLISIRSLVSVSVALMLVLLYRWLKRVFGRGAVTTSGHRRPHRDRRGKR